MSDDNLGLFWKYLPWVVFVKLAVFYHAGHFHGWWRHVTFADLVALVRASLLSLLIIVAIGYFAEPSQIPRNTLALDFVFTVMTLGALRSVWRLCREYLFPAIRPHEMNWILLLGTDDNAVMLAHQIQLYPQLAYRVRGFLDPEGDKVGTQLCQIPVLGRIEEVRAIALQWSISEVFMIAGTISGHRLRPLMQQCAEAKLTLRIIPSVEERLKGNQRIPIRSIEINDLLRRDPIVLDSTAIARLVEGRCVMVTGGGGSIGSEICRQLLRFNPRALVVLGRGENRIYHIDRELRAATDTTQICPVIANVTDRVRMQRVFEKYRPDVIFHAAAHKHVPLMEDNVGEAIKNNVLGTKCVADLADAFGVSSFVLVSTDKAVHPTSVMGVSKHLAERYVHSLSQESATRFMVTRFGNVLGSAGSVVPLFQEQIRRGGPITVTDPRMTRYFMTIPEASQLVLQAAAMGEGGEIFVLEMGEPVKIVDLARDLIRLSGLPEDAIEISFTGVRPGEKLFEELYFDDEQTLPTAHPKLRAAYHRSFNLDEVRETIASLEPLVDGSEDVLRLKLHAVVPEYMTPQNSRRATSADGKVASAALTRTARSGNGQSQHAQPNLSALHAATSVDDEPLVPHEGGRPAAG
jgi:FlaA1/EpsC-like NDP-sugar epimerase